MIGIGNHQLMKNNATSIDGKYRLAGTSSNYIHTSNDFGVTWTSRTSSGLGNAWYDGAISGTGQYMAAIGFNIYIKLSSDYGVTWANATSSPSSGYWYSISISHTGQYMVACQYTGYIYTSSNYGVTWTARTATGTQNFIGVKISSTGQYQTVVSNAGYIYTSNDYGVTWTARTAPGTLNYYNVGVDGVGQYQTAAVNGGYMQRSTNYGVSWTPVTSIGPTDFLDVDISSSGQYQTLVTYSSGLYIYTSSDYGASWTARTGAGARTWWSVGVCTSGQYQVAAVNNSGGYLYQSEDYGVSWAVASGLSISSLRVCAINKYYTPGPPSERPRYVSNTKNFAGSYPYSPVVFTKPSGVASGDLLLLLLASDTNGIDDMDPISGFTLAQSGIFSSSACQFGVYWRIADGTEGATISVTFNTDISFARGGFYVHITGANATAPIGNISAVGGSASNSTVTYTGVAGNLDDLVILIEAFDGGDGAPFTISGGDWAKADDFESGASTGVSGSFATLTTAGTAAVSVTSVAAVTDGRSGCQFRIQK